MVHTIRTIRARKGERPMRLLTVEAGDGGDARPVLLYLHGKGEAGIWPNELPHVCDHLSPPFQALLGNLDEVTVVAPQAPYDMHPPKGKPVEGDWSWRPQLRQLCRFLRTEFKGRRIVAAGFSRGGLGVLQLIEACPGLVSRWAIVDPQPADRGDEERRIIAAAGGTGWSRYTNASGAIKAMGDSVSQVLAKDESVYTPGLTHSGIALRAFQGDRLGGADSMYRHLGIRQKSPSKAAIPQKPRARKPRT